MARPTVPRRVLEGEQLPALREAADQRVGVQLAIDGALERIEDRLDALGVQRRGLAFLGKGTLDLDRPGRARAREPRRARHARRRRSISLRA